MVLYSGQVLNMSNCEHKEQKNMTLAKCIGFAVVPGTGVWTIPCQSHPSGPALSMAKAAHSLVIVVQRPARRMFAAEILVQLGELLQMILSNSSVRKRSIAALAELIA